MEALKSNQKAKSVRDHALTVLKPNFNAVYRAAGAFLSREKLPAVGVRCLNAYLRQFRSF